MRDTHRTTSWIDLRLVTAGVSAYVGWKLLGRLRQADLSGRVVLVTGGSRGLGFALAREFARHGAKVAICARDRSGLASAVEALDRQGAEGLALQCDVSDRREVRRMIRQVEGEMGPIDVLVNNASIVQVGPVGAMTEDDFRRSMAVNFWGTLHPILELLPRMRERGEGRIANITSIGGKLSAPHLLPYSCAKFAAVGLSEGLRAELGRHGIVVTTVVPGLMRTGGPAHAWFKGNPEKEFAWFSLGDATSATAMGADRAARQIVRAVRRGRAEVTLTWQARVARVAHGVAPGATAELMAGVNRLLPGEEEGREAVRGMELATSVSPSWLTTQMNRAAMELQQYAGSRRPSPGHASRIGLDGRGGGEA